MTNNNKFLRRPLVKCVNSHYQTSNVPTDHTFTCNVSQHCVLKPKVFLSRIFKPMTAPTRKPPKLWSWIQMNFYPNPDGPMVLLKIVRWMARRSLVISTLWNQSDFTLRDFHTILLLIGLGINPPGKQSCKMWH